MKCSIKVKFNKWKGPGVVIEQDGKIIFVCRASIYVRVSANRIMKLNYELKNVLEEKDQQSVSSVTLTISEEDQEDKLSFTDEVEEDDNQENITNSVATASSETADDTSVTPQIVISETETERNPTV